MSDTPEDPRREPAGDDHTGHADPQAYPGHTLPGYGGQGHTQPGYPQPGYGQPGYGRQGQDYPPPTASPYDQDPYGYQGSYAPLMYGAGGYGHPGPYGPRPGTDDATMAMLAHLLGLLTSFIGPLVLYLAKKDESPYVRAQAAEALNFQLTLMIAYVVSWVLIFVLIGFLLIFVVWIGSLILMIMAAVAANRGENYRYPMNIRFVS
ncbi:DUF4870 domain-containing protein [Streptosporangium carneum]|uniref:DUF4870 domain-containing protein n=1 Tax=Streptosporangium carneum TaxID=47481 RepID=A0A9W6I071_9ACTN|nr:DUF4870 domain-containing protein [Streptosporangium carneum]GLK09556.1 hypothetical protein GCM10017600_29620 [Streptosporangium carneum]